MCLNFSARLASLLLAGTLAAGTALAQQPSAPPAAPVQPAAPVERHSPPPPGPRGPMPMGRNFDRGHMMDHGGGSRDFGHPGMGSEFRIVPPGMWWKSPALVQRIGLTADQTKKMDEIFQQTRLQLIDLKANLDKQNLMLEPMLSANPIDQAKTLAQIDKVAQARADLEKANAKMLLGIRGVLTPDQWTKLQTRGRDAGPGGTGAQGAPAGPGGPGGASAPAGRGPGGGGRGAAMVAPEPPAGEL